MKDVIQNFDRSVAGYAAHSAPQAALAAELARWIAPAERQGRAIEFGAGTGLFTQQMQPWVGTYLATDAAPRMVEYGRAHFPLANWQVQDARQTSGLNPADWIFSCNLLQWLDEPDAALREWRKILPSGGQLTAAVLLPGALRELQSVLSHSTPLRWHATDEWRKIFRNAGFSITRESVWEHREVYPRALAFLRAVHAMGLAPRRSTGAGQLRAALRAYDQNFAAPGGVSSTWQAWLVRAVAV
jgi:trans-aconitate methyltransferase